MPKKLNPVAKIVELYETLTDEQSAIAYDLLRSKQPKRVTKKSTKKPVRPVAQQSSRRQSATEQSRSTDQQTEGATGVSGDGSEDVS